MWSAILLLGCVVGLHEIPVPSARTDTGLSADDTSASVEGSTEDSPPPQERTEVWIYPGHGGLREAAANGQGGMESIQAHWNSEGWTTIIQPELPDLEQMSRPRLLIFAAPGSRSQVRFDALDVRKIERFLESDGLLAVYVEACTNPHLNTLLSSLGLGIQLSAPASQASDIVRDAEIDRSAPLVSGVERLTMRGPCPLSVSRGTSLAHRAVDSETAVYIASGQPDAGGQAIVLGDLQLIDDAGHFDETDNRAFASNLAQRSPETVR